MGVVANGTDRLIHLVRDGRGCRPSGRSGPPGDLGITETTVKVHRSNAIRKIKATSVAELCRMVDKLKLLPESAELW
jgi:hypothetical protein